MTLDFSSDRAATTVADALECERVRSARRVALMRAVATSAHAACGFVFGGLLGKDVWRDSYVIAAVYAALAVAALVIVRRSRSLALASGVLVPLLDMTALYALQVGMVRSAADPFVVITMNLATMGFFIVASSLWMWPWLILAATLAAVVAQSVLALGCGADISIVTSFVIVLGLFGAVCVYTARRIHALVSSAAERGMELARVAEEEGRGFQELLDALPDGAIVSDGGTIRYVNAKLAELATAPRAELPGRQVAELVVEEQHTDLAAHAALVETSGAATIELHASRPDGRKLPVEISSTRVVLGGAPRIVSVVRDVTERRILSDQLLLADRMASTGTLAATIAHDINNPVTVVASGVEFALGELRRLLPDDRSEAANEVIEALDDARVAAQSVAAIVRELRVFARAEDDETVPVDVASVVESTLRIVHNEVRARARLEIALAPVPCVKGARSRLGQVIMNLVVNATQAIPEGSPQEHRVTIRTREEGAEVIIEVEDTGAGMSDEVRSRIFEPFFTTKPVGQGTGLGLAACARIVHAMGGRIEVTSSLGRGSCFRVHLPSCPDEVLTHVQRSVPPNGPPARVLVIDDEPGVLDAIARVLRDTCEVICVGSAGEALSLLETGARFDVILCDLTMPGMTGADFHERLTRVDPEHAKRTAIVSGGAISSEARAYLERAELPLLAKPFEARELRSFVSSRAGA